MSTIAAANAPLPYQPIKIIDISPYRSSIRQRPVRTRPAARVRRAAWIVAGGLAILLAVAGVATASAPVASSFDMAPGNATPPSLQR